MGINVVNTDDKANLKALLEMGVYKSEDDYLHKTLTRLLKSDKELRIKLAIHRYQTEDISLGKAAQIAGLCWEDMKQVLMDNGIRPMLGPETIEEAMDEVASTREIAYAMRKERKLRR